MNTANEQERFTRLWTATQPSVAHYVHSLVRDRAAAEDVVQETALLALRRFAEYEEKLPFVAWVIGFARFKVLSLHRDTARCPLLFDGEMLRKFTESWAEQSEAQTDRSAALEGCIDKLADHAQRVVRLRYFEDLNAEQIAAKIGGNGAVIRVTLQRIREQLRECVERNIRTEGATV